MIRLCFVGFFILTGAIIANLFAIKIECKTWYDFLQGISVNISYWNQVSIKEGLWLFFIYPLFLGLSAHTGNFLFQKIF
tara:strand:- start:205 stop:441 length:237 start_codon:yes stop_codon:yes gene_type:complete